MDQENIIEEREIEDTILEIVEIPTETPGALPTAPDAREIAYTWEDQGAKNRGEQALPSFQIIKSPNAWWMEPIKVDLLINAFKMGCNVKQACIYAGISRGQWEYFNEIHPEFSGVREAAEEVPTLIAINTIVGGLKDPENARFWLKARDKRFKPGIKVESDQPLAPTTNNLIITSNVDTTKVERLLAAAAEQFLANGGGEGTASQGS